MLRALDSGDVELTAKISVRLTEYLKDKETGEFVPDTQVFDTTVGRAILSEILPKGLPFEVLNRALKKKEISKLINASFRRCGLKETVVFADKLLQNGFRLGNACRYLDRDRRHVGAAREANIMSAAESEVKEIAQQYSSGLVTAGER